MFGDPISVEKFAQLHDIPYLGDVPLDPLLAADADSGRNPFSVPAPSAGVEALQQLAYKVMSLLKDR